MTKKSELSERDIITKYVIPALVKAGWDLKTQIREEVFFTNGRIIVKGNKSSRGERKRADVILYFKPNIPIAVIEVKDFSHSVGSGMQQSLGYADTLDVPVAFSTNGQGFLQHDRSGYSSPVEKELAMDQFPSPEEVWEIYKNFKQLKTPEQEKIATFDYFFDGTNRSPYYYQQNAINRTVEAIAKGQDRILLVMATGTGKTYTAFQIIHRLWKNHAKKRILFLADRNILLTQTKKNDFKHFKKKLTIIKKKNIDKAYEIYLALYQGLTNYNDDKDAYKQFSPDFFDLIVVDECHRGSADADSAWREILTYFKSATQIGLTATPRETETISNSEYFGDPVYTYSLRQGIADGFLAPYKVIRVGINTDLEGWRPEAGKKDKSGVAVDDRLYNSKDYDKTLVIDERTQLVAHKISEYLGKTNKFDKTIVFCVDIEHAERMRQALTIENPDLVLENPKYVMRITGDDDEGKRQVENFINPEERYPVIATTSKLMTTGVDAQTCKLIVLDSNIKSVTEFKQIIGRGTRIREDFDKTFFTIMDFRNVTDIFARPDFDGDPIRIKVVKAEDDLTEDDVQGSDDNDNGEENGGEGTTDVGTDATGGTEPPQKPKIIDGGDIISDPKPKVYVNGVDVSILNERVQHLDENGKLIVESLKDYSKKHILKEYRTLKEFLTKWNGALKKKVIIDELEAHGVILENLASDVKKDLDIFDLVCHVAWDMPPLSRRERAERVKKRNYFTKYGEKARMVINALLDKYADEGVENIEDLTVLKVDPFNAFGTPTEIIQLFGGKDKYLGAIAELENEIYTVSAIAAVA